MQLEHAGEFILTKLSNDLPGYLTYHNVDHTKDVYNAATIIGEQENISAHEMEVLLTAACFHDAGYLKGAAGHEEESCRIAREILPLFEYTDEETEEVCGLIMATKMPQTPLDHLQKIIADADLDYLGRADFFETSRKLYTELNNLDSAMSEKEWLIREIAFLEAHSYFTGTAIRLRNDKKQEHLKHLKTELKYNFHE